jgi:membrane-bound lytic murein transglycosylase D
MKRFGFILSFVCLWVGVARASVANGPESVGLDPAAITQRLRPNLDFWIRVYTQYDTQMGVIHDTKYLSCVYEVLDFHHLRGGQTRGSVTRLARQKWRRILLSLHRKRDAPATWTAAEKHVAGLFAAAGAAPTPEEPNAYLAAAHRKRLRFQLGQKNEFLAGYRSSGRYLPAMEEIFAREGMPRELTRLPFVESSFNLGALSKVGASGIWQFMRSTGKLFLKVDEAVDERNDPLRATEAAAKLLRGNYDSLGNWPLAVTAYNHGRKGLMRAVRRVGSPRLDVLMDEYRNRQFGFASSNFFVELMAAVEVERNAARYFGAEVLKREPALQAFETELPDFVALKDLVHFLHVDRGSIVHLNPALSEGVVRGALLIPAGYRLRLPGGEAERKLFEAGYAQIPALYKLQAQRRSS